MSLPETGRFEVAVEGHVLVFDGEKWTGPDNRWFNEYASLLLEMTTPQHLGTHITCPEAGRKILAAAFPGTAWTVLAAEVAPWQSELPPGCVD